MNQRKVNLFMVGAAKCGTTTIHKILAQHPDIYAGPIKEPHFFVRDEFKPHEGYRKRIALNEATYLENYAGATQEKYLVDSSVHYLYFEKSAADIKAYNPEAKIIIVLRHPVDRIYSHYKMLRKDGVTHMSFDQFIKNPIDNNQIDLIKQGFYSESIKRYLSIFGKDRVLILKFDLVKNQEALKKVLSEFLEIAPFEIEKAEHENAGGIPKNEFLRYLHIDFIGTRFLKRILPKSKFRSMIGSWVMGHFYSSKPMDPMIRKQLEEIYTNELQDLKDLGFTFER